MPAGVLRARNLRISEGLNPSSGEENVDLVLRRTQRDSAVSAAQRTSTLQSSRMSRVEAERHARRRLPTRRPTLAPCYKRSGVQTKARNNRKGVTVPCVNGYPFAATALAEAPEIGRAHGRSNQSGRAKCIGNCPRTIVGLVGERSVAAAVTIRFGVELIRGPDCTFHCERRILRRSGLTAVQARRTSGHGWPGGRKRRGEGRWNQRRQKSRAQQSFQGSGMHKGIQSACYAKDFAKERKKWG